MVDRWTKRDGERESETNRGRRIHGSMDPKRDGARLSVYPTWKPETGVPLRRERRQAYRNTGTGRVRNLGDRRRAGQYRLALITRWWNVPARWLRPGSPLGTPLRLSQWWKNHRQIRPAWITCANCNKNRSFRKLTANGLSLDWHMFTKIFVQIRILMIGGKLFYFGYDILVSSECIKIWSLLNSNKSISSSIECEDLRCL